MSRICFFTGVPIDDSATLYRAGFLAKKLREKGYNICFTSVSASFKNQEIKMVNGLSVNFIGQAHYKVNKNFSTRIRLSAIKTLTENIKTCLRFYKLLKNYKPDRVLVVTTMPVSLMAGVVSKFMGFKTIIDIEDLAKGQMQSSYPVFLIKLYGLIEKGLLKFFDKKIVPSNFLKKRYPGSIILPNMIDVNWWKRPSFAPRSGASAGKIVFVGNIGKYHGQIPVLNSLSELLKLHKNWQLIFVGGGENLNKLKVQSSKLKVQDQVVFTGQIAQLEVKKILSSADVGILPLWNTPVHLARHPLKLLEYLAAGLVVITNRVGEAQRIIKHGFNGILCPPGDIDCIASEVVKIFDNPVMIKKIRSNAIVSAQEFSVSKILPKWEEVINS